MLSHSRGMQCEEENKFPISKFSHIIFTFPTVLYKNKSTALLLCVAIRKHFSFINFLEMGA